MCTCPPRTGWTAAWQAGLGRGTATGRPRVPNETVAAACRDYPDVFTPGRCLSELEALDLPAEVMTAVLHDNAARILS